MTSIIRFSGQFLGISMLITGCLAGAKPVGIAKTSPIDNPDSDIGEAAAPSVRAFPGAEGFGANSVGGRGGRVIEVTNLNDSGPGSLRAAIETNEPRIVVFRVGGTIELQSRLKVQWPYITIAGQTAPGGGITLKNNPSHDDAPLIISTHDVVVRFIKVRPGASIQKIGSLDGIRVESGYNVIVDHSSISWATDENMDVYRNTNNITIQWSIISEGLNCSTHLEGCHSMGLLLGGDSSYNISVHHNLFAHNGERSPRINNSGLVDVVNNVIYNSGPSVVSNGKSRAKVNYVGNYYRPAGLQTSNYYVEVSIISGSGFEFFVQGNIAPSRSSDNMDESLGVAPNDRQWIVPTRHDAPLVTTTSANEAYNQVLANAGDSVGLDSQGNFNKKRDVVDERIVNDVLNGTGSIIDDPSEVGDWPQLTPGTTPADTDHDGMPDAWENLYGFNPNDSSDGNGDANGDGYTNIEEYLNGTIPSQQPHGEPTPQPTNEPSPVPTDTPAPQPTDTPISEPTNTPTPEPIIYGVTGFVLVNADTNEDIGLLSDGTVIDLASLPTQNLSVRAETQPSTVGSVVFGLDNNPNFQTENLLPYALVGDNKGDYNPWTPTVGWHTLTVTPYTERNGRGTQGTSLSVIFNVINNDPEPEPAPPTTEPQPTIINLLGDEHIELSCDGRKLVLKRHNKTQVTANCQPLQ